MVIPPETLTPETLTCLMEDFVTRDGTDYGEQELSVEQKVSILRPQVARGDVLIVFDDASQSVNLVPKQDYDSCSG